MTTSTIKIKLRGRSRRSFIAGFYTVMATARNNDNKDDQRQVHNINKIFLKVVNLLPTFPATTKTMKFNSNYNKQMEGLAGLKADVQICRYFGFLSVPVCPCVCMWRCADECARVHEWIKLSDQSIDPAHPSTDRPIVLSSGCGGKCFQVFLADWHSDCSLSGKSLHFNLKFIEHLLELSQVFPQMYSNVSEKINTRINVILVGVLTVMSGRIDSR